jgi:hypothetical protein
LRPSASRELNGLCPHKLAPRYAVGTSPPPCKNEQMFGAKQQDPRGFRRLEVCRQTRFALFFWVAFIRQAFKPKKKTIFQCLPI